MLQRKCICEEFPKVFHHLYYTLQQRKYKNKSIRRKVKVDENGMTTIPKIFAGGDIVNINLDAVTAIADAQRASQGINKFLSK